MYHTRKTNKKGHTIAPEVAFPPGHVRQGVIRFYAGKLGSLFLGIFRGF